MNDSDCTKIIGALEEKVQKYEKMLTTIFTKPRTVGKVLSFSHQLKGQLFYRVLTGNGETVVPSLYKKELPPDTEVLIVEDTIEMITPQELERIVVEHEIDLVEWNEIGGLKSQIEKIRNTVELPLKNPKIFEKFGMKPISGIMLYGEAGCGKTLIAKAIAKTVLGSYRVRQGAFIHLKGGDILDKYVGETEKIVATVFKTARDYMKENGQRSVIFIDEAEALLTDRGYSNWSAVPSFLAETDGVHDLKPLVVIATNMPERIDTAITREGRMDIKLHINRPNDIDFEEIVRIHLSGRLCQDTKKELSETAKDIVFANNELRSRVSGAMASTIVNFATNEAVVRALKVRTAPTGIKCSDIKRACEMVNV